MAISESWFGDNMEYMAKFPDKFSDLGCVDPDYGLNDLLTIGGTWSAKYKNNEGMLGGKPDKAYFDELFRISKNQVIWGGNYFNLPENRCFLIWDKVAQMPSLTDCEYAWTSFDNNAKIFRHVRNTSEKRIHITQKPIALYRWIFDNFAKKGDKIIDTNLGSASSRIAAFDLDLDFYSCEFNKDHYQNGNNRFETHRTKCEELKEFGYAKTELSKINPLLF